jgi:glycosyltransferase involved in cell wall biosynthesis
MKIAMVSCQPLVSGIGRYSFELLQHVRGIEPETVLYTTTPKEKLVSPEFIPIPHRSFKQLHPYILPYYIRNSIKKNKADLFHAHWFLSGLAISFKMTTPSVITMHDVSLLHIPEFQDGLYLRYFAWAVKRFRKLQLPLIVVSENAKKDTLSYANYPEGLVHVVHNGINSAQFYPLEKKVNKKFRIIYSGGLGKRKQVDLLLKAFKIVEQKHPDTELHIAGAFPERTPYPKMAENMNLKHVLFTGYIPEDKMNEFYNAGDLLVYPSSYEGFGFAPLEAMAAGVPVICSTNGALAEINGDAIMPIEQHTPEDIAEKITYVIDHPSVQECLRRKGFDRVKNFTWEKAAEKTMNIYSSLL